MNSRIEDLKSIIPSWKEDINGSPVLDPKELAGAMQVWAKEKAGIDVPAPSIEEAKSVFSTYAALKGLKQPIFIERN